MAKIAFVYGIFHQPCDTEELDVRYNISTVNEWLDVHGDTYSIQPNSRIYLRKRTLRKVKLLERLRLFHWPEIAEDDSGTAWAVPKPGVIKEYIISLLKTNTQIPEDTYSQIDGNFHLSELIDGDIIEFRRRILEKGPVTP